MGGAEAAREGSPPAPSGNKLAGIRHRLVSATSANLPPAKQMHNTSTCKYDFIFRSFCANNGKDALNTPETSTCTLSHNKASVSHHLLDITQWCVELRFVLNT
eukprot:4486870-Pyramimonas_sp.AAC.1